MHMLVGGVYQTKINILIIKFDVRTGVMGHNVSLVALHLDAVFVFSINHNACI